MFQNLNLNQSRLILYIPQNFWFEKNVDVGFEFCFLNFIRSFVVVNIQQVCCVLCVVCCVLFFVFYLFSFYYNILFVDDFAQTCRVQAILLEFPARILWVHLGQSPLSRPNHPDWSISLALEIILALVTGSILSMWFSELITEEGLGNGSSMLIFINIVGSIPNSFSELNNALFSQASYLDNLRISGQGLIFYLFVVSVIILFQDSYKKINIVAAKQLNLSSSDQSQNFSQLKNSYIPLKVNQGGIMPLVFSSTIAVFLAYPVQQLLNLGFVNNSFLSVYSITINILLVVLFSCFYAGLVLKPDDISQNLAKMAYSIPGVRQGKDTTKYLEKTVARLAFLGGLFLAFLAFFPLVVGNVLQVNIFKNVTSLLILIGVITDVTSQIRGYLVARKYEGFK